MEDVYFLKLKNEKTNGGDNKKKRIHKPKTSFPRKKQNKIGSETQSLCFNDVAKLISVRMFSKRKNNKV